MSFISNLFTAKKYFLVTIYLPGKYPCIKSYLFSSYDIAYEFMQEQGEQLAGRSHDVRISAITVDDPEKESNHYLLLEH